MENRFLKDTITIEEGFWTMFYFLKEHYDLSGGEFDISDILSTSQPATISGTDIKIPVDSAMIDYWNEAFEKYKKNGMPPLQELR